MFFDRRAILKSVGLLLPLAAAPWGVSQKRKADEWEPLGEPFMGGFLKGNDYRAMSKQQQLAYVVGIWDGYMFAPALGGKSKNDQVLYDCLPHLEGDQLQAIVDKYLNENPDKWGHSMNWIVFSALPRECRLGM